MIANRKIFHAGLINEIDGVELSCLSGFWQIVIEAKPIFIWNSAVCLLDVM